MPYTTVSCPASTVENKEDASGAPKTSTLLYSVILFAIITALTSAITVADTFYYIMSVLDYSGGRDFAFWDFGHLLWRPAIWMLFHAFRWIFPRIPSSHLILTQMLVVNWFFGLGSVLLMVRIARRFATELVAAVVATALIFSQVFLNYVHTGAPYITGLFFLILAMEYGSAKRRFASAIAGVSLAIAVLLWLPYIFVLPALFLYPGLIHGFKRESLKSMLLAVTCCGLVGLGVYGAAAAYMRLFTISEFAEWFHWASHSIDHIAGLTRAIFGFCRSWYQIENVGIEVRRFLVHDPFVHTSLTSLAIAGFWKVVFTYLFIGVTLVKLFLGPSRDRRIFLFVLAAFVPVFAFGVKWQGGDMERYMAAFPMILLGVACAWSSSRNRAFKALVVAFTLSLAVVNTAADLKRVRDAENRELSARLGALRQLSAASYVVMLPADPLYGFIVSSSVLNSNEPSLVPIPVVRVGSSHAEHWRDDFASAALAAWTEGKQLWVFQGLWDPIPQKQWGWVEGAEPLVHWRDFREFLNQFQTSTVRGEFVELPATSSNVEKLRSFISNPASR